MNRFHCVLSCVVTVFVVMDAPTVRAQFGGGGGDRHEVARKALQDAVERAESMMQGEAPGTRGPQQSCLCVGESSSPGVDKITKALKAPLRSGGLDFAETPLREIVGFLQNEYDISVQLDQLALDEMGIGPDEPVTIAVTNMSLESALRLMLEPLQLNYIIQHEALLITTNETAAEQLKVCVYDIGDLIGSNQPKAMQSLVDAIVSCTATPSWTAHGGEGDIRPVPPNVLVISQTQDVHAEIRGLLAALRAMRKQSSAGDEAAPSPANPVVEAQ